MRAVREEEAAFHRLILRGTVTSAYGLMGVVCRVDYAFSGAETVDIQDSFRLLPSLPSRTPAAPTVRPTPTPSPTPILTLIATPTPLPTPSYPHNDCFHANQWGLSLAQYILMQIMRGEIPEQPGPLRYVADQTRRS